MNTMRNTRSRTNGGRPRGGLVSKSLLADVDFSSIVRRLDSSGPLGRSTLLGHVREQLGAFGLKLLLEQAQRVDTKIAVVESTDDPMVLRHAVQHGASEDARALALEKLVAQMREGKLDGKEEPLTCISVWARGLADRGVAVAKLVEMGATP